jgi:hemolysin III
VYYGERFNSISHLVGASLALVGGAALVTSAAIDGDQAKIVSYTIYAATLFILYLSSTLYHSISASGAKEFLQKVDHQAIYLLIAGTYTPFIVVAVNGNQRWWMLGAVWGMAVFGMILDALPRRGARIVPVIIYLVMGWLCVFFPDSFLSALPSATLWWLIAGGVFYTSGVIFFALDSWYPWCHGIWHLFVLAGSISHYIAILLL